MRAASLSVAALALALPALAQRDFAANPVRVSMIGDSITAGVCSTNGEDYPFFLQELLGPNYVVMNFGNSGKTMLKKGLCGPPPAGDCAYWDTPTWPAAQASTPDIVTILLGTNDAKTFNMVNGDVTNYTADYLSMTTILHALPTNPKLFVGLPPPLYPPFPYSMNETIINSIFPALLRTIAVSANATGVVDCFNAVGGAGLTQPGATCDGCHPRSPAYLEMAQAFFLQIVNVAKSEGWPAPVHTPGFRRPENAPPEFAVDPKAERLPKAF